MSNEILRGDGAIRRPGLTGSSIENTFGGVLGFMRVPLPAAMMMVVKLVMGIPYFF